MASNPLKLLKLSLVKVTSILPEEAVRLAGIELPEKVPNEGARVVAPSYTRTKSPFNWVEK